MSNKNFSPNVNFVSKMRNVSYEKAKEEMDFMRDEFGIIYKLYVSEKLYKYNSFSQKYAAVKRVLEKEEASLRKVLADTDLTFEQAKERADHVKKKFNMTYTDFYRYRFFALTDEEIQKKVSSWTEQANELRGIAAKKSGWTIEEVTAHMKRITSTYSITQPYYVCFRAWELEDKQIEGYARHETSRKLWRKYNDKEAIKILSDKLRFNQTFAEYTGRKFWLNRNSSFEEFLAFTEGLTGIFLKPVEAGGGNGAESITLPNDYDQLKDLYENLMARERTLVEERIIQHHELSEFAPNCVNTVRVITLKKDNKVQIIGSVIKFARNQIVDNFEQGGMLASVDVERGVVCTNAVDNLGEDYAHHPITGKAIKGFVIPNWESVVRIAKNAMNVVEGINYVGWDIAICEDKAVIVEGNSMPDLSMNQAPYAPEHIGLREYFEKFL